MARIYNLPCLLMIVVFNIVTAEDYSNLQSCGKKTHTMCKYSSQKPASACGQSYSTGLNDEEKCAILCKHNQIRRKVASGQEYRGNPGPQCAAVSMPDLTWDDELATIAQRWANQCEYKHDECRNVKRFEVGQNIFQTSGENSCFGSMIEERCNVEVTKYPKNCISSYDYKRDSETSCYTQLVWANTTRIGCGRIKYKDSTNCNKEYLVCNYGPKGNVCGEKVYEEKVYAKY